MPQLLSPHTTTTEPTHLEPVLHNKRSHRNEKPVHRNEEYPRSPQLEKAHTQQRRPNAAKIKIISPDTKGLLICSPPNWEGRDPLPARHDCEISDKIISLLRNLLANYSQKPSSDEKPQAIQHCTLGSWFPMS